MLLTVSDETCNQKFYVCGYIFVSERKHVRCRGRRSTHSVMQNFVFHERECRKKTDKVTPRMNAVCRPSVSY